MSVVVTLSSCCWDPSHISCVFCGVFTQSQTTLAHRSTAVYQTTRRKTVTQINLTDTSLLSTDHLQCKPLGIQASLAHGVFHTARRFNTIITRPRNDLAGRSDTVFRSVTLRLCCVYAFMHPQNAPIIL